MRTHFTEISIAAGKNTALVLVVSLIVPATAVLFFFDPRTTWFFPQCPFLVLTGLACPGCGTSRALHALLHGHVTTAFAFNPLLFVAPPLIGLVHWLSQRSMRSLRALHLRNVSSWTLLVLVLAFWIWRNLPGYPLTV